MADHGERRRAPRTGIVVVNYGSHDLIERNLAGAVGDGSGTLTVVVVDNFSTAAEREACEAMCRLARWEFVPSPNVGFGEGVNAGVERLVDLGCDVVVMVNPDLAVSREALERLARLAGERPDRLVAPRIVTPLGNPWGRLGVIALGEGRLYTHGEDPGSPRWLSGACLALSVPLWRRLGGFTPGYFMYWEDVDLSYRVQRAGGELLLDDELVLVHDAGGTQPGGSAKSTMFTYYNCRNRLVFAALNLDRSLRWVWIRTSGAELRRAIGRANQTSTAAKLTRALWPALVGTASGLAFLAGVRPSSSTGRRIR